MINFFKLIIFLILYSNEAYSNELVNLRFGSHAENKRIVLDLLEDESFSYKLSEKKIQITFNNQIKLNDKIKVSDNLSSITYDIDSKNLSLNFNKPIFSTNIYLLKKKKKYLFKNCN